MNNLLLRRRKAMEAGGVDPMLSQPFTITALSNNCDIYIDVPQSQYAGVVNSIKMRVDDEPWITPTNDGTTFYYDDSGSTAKLNEGQTLQIIADAVWMATNTSSSVTNGPKYVDVIGLYNLSGNIMSLCNGDDFDTDYEFGTNESFSGFFYGTGTVNDGIVDASGLRLPATTLYPGAYYNLFASQYNMVNGPSVISAETLGYMSCASMFSGCYALTEAPKLTAKTAAGSAYRYMFNNCMNLVSAKDLVVAETLTGTQNCARMFYDCTALVEAPTLPAMTLTTRCYQDMFNGCERMTTAPDLPALTLVSSCYSTMFRFCETLNYVKAMFTTTPGTSYTTSWLGNVSSSGTFVKNSAAQWNVTGPNGIPSGWTVQTASE